MCIARNPYQQPNTLLFEFEESLINTATVPQDDTPIFTSITAPPSKQMDVSVKNHLSRSNFIKILIFVCLFPIVIFLAQQNFRAQQKEMDAQTDAIHATMLRIQTLRDRQNKRLADLDILTQQMREDF